MAIRIGNGAGFWGDNLDAPRLLAESGQLDYLTLEYLAELTLSILAHLKSRNPSAGYVNDFVTVAESLIPALHDQPALKLVTNAGDRGRALHTRLGPAVPRIVRASREHQRRGDGKRDCRGETRAAGPRGRRSLAPAGEQNSTYRHGNRRIRGSIRHSSRRWHPTVWGVSIGRAHTAGTWKMVEEPGRLPGSPGFPSDPVWG